VFGICFEEERSVVSTFIVSLVIWARGRFQIKYSKTLCAGFSVALKGIV
jgi:hypothetical protein